jgi:ATP-binding cassette, subfamily B, bacterial IrtA/YbtP
LGQRLSCLTIKGVKMPIIDRLKMSKKNKRNKKRGIPLLLEIAGEGAGRLSSAALLVLLSSACSVGPFFVAYRIIEKIINRSFLLSDLFALGGWAALFIVGQLVFAGTAMTQSHIAAYNILFNLRVKLARKMTRLPLGFYEKNSSGFIKKIMMNDIEAVEEFVAHNLVDLLSLICIPIIIFVWLATLNVPLALLSIVPVFGGTALQRLRARMEADSFQRLFKLKGQMNSTIVEFIRGMPVIKAFNQSVFSFAKYRDEVEDYSRYWIEMNRKGSLFFAAFAFMMDSGILFLLPVGSYMYLAGTIPLSSLLIFLFLGMGLTRFMKQLAQFGSNITQIAKGIETLNAVMNAPELAEDGHVTSLDNYNVAFKNVTFGYDKKPVFENVSFEVPQGTITALVGTTGAGKTTIGRLIPRFWDVSDGEITVGGVNIKDIRSDVLTDKVSFVFQDVFMFNDTVFENIRMGDASIDKERVVEIAKKAQCRDFIEKLPDGYDTVIGTGGTFLSGGEQQRISIARAIAKDAPIVILDEATSYADPESEADIQKALSVLLKDKTVLIIAHRLGTVRNADQILVLGQRRVLERGTHDRLCAAAGTYKKMWDMYIDASEWKIRRPAQAQYAQGMMP